MHPDDVALELVGHLGGCVAGADDVAATGVDLVGEGDRHRLPGDRLVEVTVERDDARHVARGAGGQHPDRVARPDGAADDPAREAAEVEVGAVHPLHGQTERQRGGVVVDLDGLEEPHQGRPVVPVHVRARLDDVVALQRRHRDERQVVDVELLRERPVVGLDRRERRLRVVDEVHLVDRDDDVLDAEQRHEEAVPAGLREHALAGVDEDHGDVGGRGAGHHVAGVLLVARACRRR